MTEEAEAATDVVQMEDTVLLQMEDHLHVALMKGHQTEDHLPAVLMADHQVEGAALHEPGVTDHLQPAREEAAVADLIAHHQKEEVVHQVVDMDVKKVLLPTDKFSQNMPIEK